MSFHKTMSYIKSGVRLFGYLCLLISIPLAALVLFISEMIGILEEIKEK